MAAIGADVTVLKVIGTAPLWILITPALRMRDLDDAAAPVS